MSICRGEKGSEDGALGCFECRFQRWEELATETKTDNEGNESEEAL